MDVTKLNDAVAALVAQVTETEGVEASAVTVIEGFSTAIQDAVAQALAADNAADDATAAAVADAITQVTARYTASAGKLGAAISAAPSKP